jgi:hypothetical protein
VSTSGQRTQSSFLSLTALSLRAGYKYLFGQPWDTTPDCLNTWDILWAREHPFHSSLCLIVRPSEIEWDSSALLWELHLVTLDPLSWLWIACCSWVFPDALNGLEQRWYWARDWRLFGASPMDLWGVLEPSLQEITIGYSSGLLMAWRILILCWSAVSAEGLALKCQLARDPSSGCIATMRTSLPGSKWTSIKNLVSFLAEDSLVTVIDSLLYIYSSTSV